MCQINSFAFIDVSSLTSCAQTYLTLEYNSKNKCNQTCSRETDVIFSKLGNEHIEIQFTWLIPNMG